MTAPATVISPMVDPLYILRIRQKHTEEYRKYLGEDFNRVDGMTINEYINHYEPAYRYKASVILPSVLHRQLARDNFRAELAERRWKYESMVAGDLQDYIAHLQQTIQELKEKQGG